jgi:anti-anti-sigma regulatory factor
MMSTEIDKSKNLLRLSFSGKVDPEEARAGEKRVAGLLEELGHGFRLLTDLTALESMDHGCVPEIERTMDLCNKKGISLVVRVIPDPHKDIGFNIMSLFHYRRGLRIVTCDTLAEAERVIDQ